jgi:BlaI family penicillinase repressor
VVVTDDAREQVTKRFIDMTNCFVYHVIILPEEAIVTQPSRHEPTDRELSILRILWEHGPSSVREVHRILNEQEKLGRTSVLKIMQIMHDKGLVTRKEGEYSQIYSAAQPKEEVQTKMVNSFLQRVFGGSATNLVARMLEAKPASDEELTEIRKLINKESEGEQ